MTFSRGNTNKVSKELRLKKTRRSWFPLENRISDKFLLTQVLYFNTNNYHLTVITFCCYWQFRQRAVSSAVAGLLNKATYV